MLLTNVEKRNIRGFLAFSGGFQAMTGPPRAQRVPKIENIVCHEKTRLNILLQDDFILEIGCNSHQRWAKK